MCLPPLQNKQEDRGDQRGDCGVTDGFSDAVSPSCRAGFRLSLRRSGMDGPSILKCRFTERSVSLRSMMGFLMARPSGIYRHIKKASHELSGELDRYERSIHHTIDENGRLILRYLEMDVAHACNLTCEFCSHYSNLRTKGVVSYKDGEKWINEWSKKLNPITFRILGGEPFINNDLSKFIELTANAWPDARRAVVSNGLLFERHLDVLDTLRNTDTELHITVHVTPKPLDTEKIRSICKKNGVTVKIFEFDGMPDKFRKFYKETDNGILPFSEGEPDISFRFCFTRCPTIHLGRLWPCPPTAFLNLIDDRYQLSQNPEWQPYLQFKGLLPSASPEEIIELLAAPNPNCAMCPTKIMTVSGEEERFPGEFTIRDLENRIAMMQKSKSWLLTTPLRVAKEIFR